MSDNDDDDLEVDEFYDWFDMYYRWFPPDLMDGLDPKQEITQFYNGTYCKIMQNLGPEVRKLIYKQYPEMELEMRPEVIQKINAIIFRTGSDFLVHLFNLLYDESKGVDLRQKYPDFNKWVELYARSYDPFREAEKVFVDTPWLTEEQKKEIVEEGEREDLFGINRKRKRKEEFIDMLQGVVLRQYPSVENLSADGWIVYSRHITLEYAEFKFDSDFIGTYIALKLPDEDIRLSYSELQTKFDKIYEEKIRESNEAFEKGEEAE